VVHADERPLHRLPQAIEPAVNGDVTVARSQDFAGRLHTQFAQGRAGKTHLVRVQGHPEADQFGCDRLPRLSGGGRQGVSWRRRSAAADTGSR
jgi:23S rRNA-/tRNA-specific pseudouridylate synthase